MKKKLYLIALTSVLLLAAGCGKNEETTERESAQDAVGEMTEEEPTEEEPTESEPVDQEMADQETAESETSEPETSEPASNEADTSAYDNILSEICSVLESGQDMTETENEYISTGIEEAALWRETPEERLQSISYCYYDINGDGNDELIIVETDDSDRILDIYSISGGEYVHVAEGWSRNRLFLLDDNTIFNSGSSGAMYTNNELFELSADASELVSVGLYFTYPKDEEMYEVGFYYNGDGVYDVAVSTEITEAEFSAFYDECTSRVVTLDTENLREY